MEKFKPRKSVKRFVCETLISTLISSLILTLIVVFYNQENLGISVVVLILFFILDVLFSMYGEVKEYQIDEKGIIRIVCYLGFSKAMIKDVTQVFFDPQRKALRIISKKGDRWCSMKEPELFVDALYEYYPQMEYEVWR